MAQFARPTGDVTDGNWLNESASAVDMYQSIDEASASDSDYIESGSAPSSDVYVTSLGTVEDPLSSSGHTLRYRYQKDAAAGAQINLTVQLRQGYISEVSLGTLIKEITLTNIGNGWTTGSTTLSGGEADSITDYSDLFLRLVATQV